jgi:hypothetical protein
MCTRQLPNRNHDHLSRQRWTIVQWGLHPPQIPCAVCAVPMQLRTGLFTNARTGGTTSVRLLVCPQCGDPAGSSQQATAWQRKPRRSPRHLPATANS